MKSDQRLCPIDTILGNKFQIKGYVEYSNLNISSQRFLTRWARCRQAASVLSLVLVALDRYKES